MVNVSVEEIMAEVEQYMCVRAYGTLFCARYVLLLFLEMSSFKIVSFLKSFIITEFIFLNAELF